MADLFKIYNQPTSLEKPGFALMKINIRHKQRK